MNQFNQPKFEDKVSLSLQIVSIFAVASGFFGFLIVNAYLALYGFWDFNFLKIQYFSAGGLFLFFILVPSLFFYIFFKATEILERYKTEDENKLKTVVLFICKILLFILIFYFSFFLTFTLLLHTPILKFVGIVWTLLIFGLVWIIRISHHEITIIRESKLNLKNIVAYFVAHFRLVYIFVAFHVFVLMFSFFVYPIVPRYFGGGKPSAVSITYEKGLNANESEITEGSYALLIYQSADSLLIKSINGTYLIKQNSVAYIKYLDDSNLFNIIEYSINSKLPIISP